MVRPGSLSSVEVDRQLTFGLTTDLLSQHQYNAALQAEVLDRSTRIARTKYSVWSDMSLDELNLATAYRYISVDIAGTAPDLRRAFQLTSPPASDPDGHFETSDEQKSSMVAFKRLSELHSEPKILSSECHARGISQNCITDCSVIAALIACFNHHETFNSHVSTSPFQRPPIFN